MLTTVLFLRYNNYYNRQLKRLETAQDYDEYILDAQPNCNFILNDGITTEFTMNTYEGEIPDYILVLEPGTININSRWFVIEAVKNCKGQFKLTLFRDTLADYLNEIMSAPIFVEKGMLSSGNPLIFNQEDMTFNQIREVPEILFDKTEIPWIVGYIPKDAEFNEPISVDINMGAAQIDFDEESVEDWEYGQYVDSYNTYFNVQAATKIRVIKKLKQQLTYLNQYYEMKAETGEINMSAVNISDLWTGTYYYDINNSLANVNWDLQMQDYLRLIREDENYRTNFDNFLNANLPSISDELYSELNALNGKTLKAGSTLYRIEVENLIDNQSFEIRQHYLLSDFLKNNIPHPTGGTMTPLTFTIDAQFNRVFLKLNQITTKTSVTLSSPAERNHLENEPYDMFCMPYGDITMESNTIGGIAARNIGTALASAIAAQAGAGSVYDVQILPYCPVLDVFNSDEMTLYLDRTKYDLVHTEDDEVVSAVIWCRKSSFTFNIDWSIPMEYDPVLLKVYSQTRVYRLVSPNYSSIFEFNPYKNGGVDAFRIDCNYKPYNPYIRVAPHFKGLYGYGGQEDGRGLILNGDFSITQLTNAWANYELQNKNYNEIFLRQIQNMEVNNKYQRTEDIFNAFTGTASTAAGGAMTGAMIGGASGGGWGMAIGAGVGATVGAGAGFVDVFLKEKLRNEAINYAYDQFGYNLGNIQAIPTAISKSSVMTINNPLVPMLETYKCTAVEEEAFKNKIKYNGMTVMAIGTMGEYTEGYFKGKLIRLEGIDEDFHVINVISGELNKGVYL